MATYAAMVEMVADVLKKKGLYENTVFLFLSDDHGSTSHGCSGSSTSRI
jgi:arylsulfatase A-like enzyme